jgi:hypothetical protein
LIQHNGGYQQLSQLLQDYYGKEGAGLKARSIGKMPSPFAFRATYSTRYGATAGDRNEENRIDTLINILKITDYWMNLYVL